MSILDTVEQIMTDAGLAARRNGPTVLIEQPDDLTVEVNTVDDTYGFDIAQNGTTVAVGVFLTSDREEVTDEALTSPDVHRTFVSQVQHLADALNAGQFDVDTFGTSLSGAGVYVERLATI